MKKTNLVKKIAASMMVAMAVTTTTTVPIYKADAAPAATSTPVGIIINGKKAIPDSPPYVVSGRVMVPLRFISDQFGSKLTLNGKDITITKGKQVIKLTIGSRTAVINGKQIDLGAPSEVKLNRTMVPLRLVGEGFGVNVRWDAISKLVWIGEEKVPTQETGGFKKGKIEDYKKYFGKIDYMFKEANDVTIFTQNDLPINLSNKFGDSVIFRVWIEKVNGAEVMKIHYSGKKFSVYYFIENDQPRPRQLVSNLTVNNKDGSFIDTFDIASDTDFFIRGIKDWNKLKATDIAYIAFGADLDTLPLLSKPFAK